MLEQNTDVTPVDVAPDASLRPHVPAGTVPGGDLPGLLAARNIARDVTGAAGAGSRDGWPARLRCLLRRPRRAPQPLTACAAAGLDLTVQADWIVGHELRSGTLRHLLSDCKVETTTFNGPAVRALYPSCTYLPLKVRAFVSFLEEQYRDSPPRQACLTVD